MELNAVCVDIVIPVYNEEDALEGSITRLRQYLQAHCPYSWCIVIADNASTDRTAEIALELESRWPDEVRHFHLVQKGRGRALRLAWLGSDADIMSYMDVDLSTGLNAFMPLIEPLAQGTRHVAIGSRLAQGARIQRSIFREFTSRAYNLLIKLLFPGKQFSDAQCGFKAITRQTAQELIPLVENNNWFFDSELLLLAERRGYTVHEVPVRWVEDPGSTVHIAKTAWEDIRGLLRMRFGQMQSQ
jgi:glycosyltransferase involved in cell wall biosynthesis